MSAVVFVPATASTPVGSSFAATAGPSTASSSSTVWSSELEQQARELPEAVLKGVSFPAALAKVRLNSHASDLLGVLYDDARLSITDGNASAGLAEIFAEYRRLALRKLALGHRVQLRAFSKEQLRQKLRPPRKPS